MRMSVQCYATLPLSSTLFYGLVIMDWMNVCEERLREDVITCIQICVSHGMIGYRKLSQTTNRSQIGCSSNVNKCCALGSRLNTTLSMLTDSNVLQCLSTHSNLIITV